MKRIAFLALAIVAALTLALPATANDDLPEIRMFLPATYFSESPSIVIPATGNLTYAETVGGWGEVCEIVKIDGERRKVCRPDKIVIDHDLSSKPGSACNDADSWLAAAVPGGSGYDPNAHSVNIMIISDGRRYSWAEADGFATTIITPGARLSGAWSRPARARSPRTSPSATFARPWRRGS